MKRAGDHLAACPSKLLKTESACSGTEPDDSSSSLSDGLPRLMELLQHEHVSVRLKALGFLHSHLEMFRCNDVFLKVLPTLLLNRMWNEESAHVAQQIVRVLASMVILSRRKPIYTFRLKQSLNLNTTEQDPTAQEYAKDINLNQMISGKQNVTFKTSIAQSIGPHVFDEEFRSTVVHNLLFYFQGNCFHGLTVKLQILRSLQLMAEEAQAVPMYTINTILKLLIHSNSFVRGHVLQLITAVLLTDPKVKSSKDTEHFTVVFYEYTHDSSVYVRMSALQSLLILCSNGYLLTKECYIAASSLLNDLDEEVRSLSLHVIKLWVEQKPEENTNDAFIQVCKLMTDMDFSVRTEACKTFATMKNVKEDLLLQALSKQPLELPSGNKEPSVSSLITIPETDVDVSKYEQGLGVLDKSNMGAFVHGIEDEFYEVRALTVKALEGMYGFSTKARKIILEVMINMLNDDSKHVRMCALHALICASEQYGLPIKDSDLHTFHAMLEDIDEDVRILGMKLLGQIQLSSKDGFKCTIETLRNYMCKNPQEVYVIHTLYRLGKGHQTYLQFIIKDLLKELRSVLSMDIGIDAPSCRCIFTLFSAVSEGEINSIPSHILSLAQLFKQDMNLKHHVWDTSATNAGAQGFRSFESMNVSSKGSVYTDSSNQKSTIVNLLQNAIRSAWNIKNMLKHEMIVSMKQVLSGCRKDLRSLFGINLEEDQAASTTLTMCYVECIALLSQGWIHFHCKSLTSAMPSLHQLATRLDYIVTYMLHAYVGYAPEQKFSLLEISMIPVLWKMAETTDETDYKKLSSIIMAIHDTCLPLNHFMEEVKKHILNAGLTDSLSTCKFARHLVSSFWPILLPTNGAVRQLKVDLSIANIDPLPFLPGLSFGITIRVSSQNLRDSNRIWICVQSDSLWRQFMFLDTECLGQVDKIVATIQLPGLPSVSACTLKATAVMECPSMFTENDGRGPKGYILPLTRAKEIRLVSTS